MRRGDPHERRFAVLLAAIVLVGAAWRVGYVLTVTRHDTDLYDATYYELQAGSIANGQGWFHDPFLLLRDPDDHQPAADHPPLTVLAILPAAIVDDRETSSLLMRLLMVVAGSTTVALIGLLGRTVGGPAVGLVAAGMAAADPHLWINDGLIMPETLATLLTLAVVAGVHPVLAGRGPPWRWAAGLGAAVGLATLARAELALLLPVLVVPALVAGGRRGVLRPVLVAAGAFALVVAPWVGYNLARFEEPTTVANSLGVALRAANCPATYHGSMLGYADVFPPCTEAPAGREQSVWDAELRRDALRFMGDNVERLPVVVAARLGRMWNVYRVGQTVELAADEGRPAWAGWLGVGATWVLVPLATVGAVALRRRILPAWPLLVPVVVVTAVAVVGSAGLVRYRAPAEPGVIVLAAVGSVGSSQWVRTRSGRAAVTPETVDGDDQ